MSTAVEVPSRPEPASAPLRALRGDALTYAALGIIAFLVVIAVLGPLLPFGSPYRIGVGPRLAGPSMGWVAGTDSLGRSLLPRIVVAVRTTFLLAGLAVLISVFVGVLLGIVAAYYRGVIGELIVRMADVWFAFPGVILALLVVAVIGPGILAAVISIAVLSTPLTVRVVRAAALQVVDREFIVAARVGGTGSVSILVVHVLPNIAGTAVVQATYLLVMGMLIESGLSFLGLGVQPPQASLGSLVHEGSAYLPVASWLVLFPGIILALAITAVNLLGDWLRDLLDVRSEEVRR